jgi:hypothetical protein
MMVRGLSPTMVYPRTCSAGKSVAFPAPGPPVITVRDMQVPRPLFATPTPRARIRMRTGASTRHLSRREPIGLPYR